MEKKVRICDFCEMEVSSPILIEVGEVCNRCSKIWYESLSKAITQIEKKVNFTVSYRVTLLDLLANNASEKYWGSEGVQLRKKIIEELELNNRLL